MKCPLLCLKHLKIVTVAATRFIFFAKWSDFDIHDNHSPAISERSICSNVREGEVTGEHGSEVPFLAGSGGWGRELARKSNKFTS